MSNKINRTIRLLILSDFFLFFALGLLSPIYAVFILENIENRLEVIGYAVACYWLARVFLVIPFSRLMDKIKGEFDEYYFMIIGTVLIAMVPLFYLFSSAPWHIYILQLVNGLAHSMAVPAWRIVFTKNIDKKIIGFEWSLEDVGVGLATATSAALGAIVADKLGFPILFVTISFFGLISALILLILGKSKKLTLRDLLRGQPDSAPLKLDTFK